MDSRFNVGPSFKKHKKKRPLVEDDRFSKLKDFEKLEKYTDAIVDPFGRPISGIKSIGSDKYDSDNEYIESEAEIEVSDQHSSIWDREGDIELGDPTYRIAVIGCDWDNINSTDIYVLFQTMYDSYVHEKNIEASNVVKKVSIYLSEFGKSRIPNENLNGPTLSITSSTNSDKKVENGEGEHNILQDDDLQEDEVPDEAYRTYQLEKSRYYYAIVELNSVEIAKVLYDELDGVEVGFAVNSLDLRFVPDDIQFNDNPVSEATEIPSGYNPPVTNVSAFRHSKAICSWDLAPAKRTKILTKRYKSDELDELYLNEYLASDHSYSEDDDKISNLDDKISENDDENEKSTDCIKSDKNRNKLGSKQNKYRELLLSAACNGDKYDKFGSKRGKSVEGSAGGLHISFNTIDDKSEGDVSDDLSEDSDENIIERKDYTKKIKKGIVQKHDKYKIGTSDKMDTFHPDLDDPRFSKVFKDENYEIDITNPNYKHTQVNKSILEKRRKKLSGV